MAPSNVCSWHNQSHCSQRFEVFKSIFEITAGYELAKDNPVQFFYEREMIARRLELALYCQAASIDEYKNLRTVRRRLQALAVFSRDCAETPVQVLTDRNALARSPAADQANSPAARQILSGKKRMLQSMSCSKKEDGPSANNFPKENECQCGKKRPRVLPLSDSSVEGRRRVTSPEPAVVQEAVEEYTKESETFILNSNIELLSTVFGFLNGTDVMKNLSLCKFASRHLPNMVTCLKLDIATAQRLVDQHGSNYIFERFPHLEKLAIHGPEISMQQAACSRQENVDIEGDAAVVRILNALALLPSQRKLSTLDLSYSFSSARRIAPAIKMALESSGKTLTELKLRGTWLGDRGVGELCLALAQCPKLVALDLSENFISATGVVFLAMTLSRGVHGNLRSINLSGNICTDSALAPLLDVIQGSKALPKLTTLLLGDNFLEVPALSRIQSILASR